MRWCWSFLLLALFLAPLSAQDAQEEDGTQAWKVLQAEYRKASQEYYAARRAATTDEERRELAQRHPTYTFLPIYREHAKKYANKSGAVPALVSVLSRTRDRDEKKQIVNTLLQAHLQSEALGQAAFSFRYLGDEGREALRTIAAKSPHRNVRGKMLFVLGQSVKSSDPEEAMKIFLRVKKEYADVPFYGTKTFGSASDGEIFELENLQLGMTAPEIEGTDQVKVAFKLSDYRGKVVVLDFWGDW